MYGPNTKPGERGEAIGITFEPDAAGRKSATRKAWAAGISLGAYDLETVARAAERPLDELARQLADARACLRSEGS